MKNVSKRKYDNIVRSYWEEFFIILIVIGVCMIISSVAYMNNNNDNTTAVLFACGAILCIILGIATMFRLRDYQKNYEPKEEYNSNKTRNIRGIKSKYKVNEK